ncbi:hypothetical protein PIB30_067726 [Stylosanthes scabra]|uniref:Secreted protein n=1 Tax=Stylosanthes scabra TaxID=79078 RepID=A0ABU6TP99_9FABA|nr:hypothetical protein [Stylosanthes scabra]
MFILVDQSRCIMGLLALATSGFSFFADVVPPSFVTVPFFFSLSVEQIQFVCSLTVKEKESKTKKSCLLTPLLLPLQDFKFLGVTISLSQPLQVVRRWESFRRHAKRLGISAS